MALSSFHVHKWKAKGGESSSKTWHRTEQASVRDNPAVPGVEVGCKVACVFSNNFKIKIRISFYLVK